MGTADGGTNASGTTNKDTSNDMSIVEWMEVFRELYEDVDRRRSPVEMWIAATAHFSTMGEAIRRMHFADLMYAAAHAFCWMCSFVLACQRDKETVFGLEESFSSIVTCKYPLVCGHCLEAYCHCNPKLMDKSRNKAAHYGDLLKKRELLGDAPDKYTVSCWLEVFNGIYGQHIHMLTLESIGFHFLEEAGEELTAIRGLMQLRNIVDVGLEGVDTEFLKKLTTFQSIVGLYEIYVGQKPEPQKREPEAIKARLVHAKVNMFIEFADTFSWLCSILNKVMSIARNCDEDRCSFTHAPFGKKLLQEYLPDRSPRCPSCEECPCRCVFYMQSSPTANSTSDGVNETDGSFKKTTP